MATTSIQLLQQYYIIYLHIYKENRSKERCKNVPKPYTDYRGKMSILTKGKVEKKSKTSICRERKLCIYYTNKDMII